jgi:hypothetical protein
VALHTQDDLLQFANDFIFQCGHNGDHDITLCALADICTHLIQHMKLHYPPTTIVQRGKIDSTELARLSHR